MRLFNEDSGRVVPAPEILAIQEFAQLAVKPDAAKHFAFIWHANSWESPYAVYGEDRRERVAVDVYGKKDVPKVISSAERKFVELSKTDSVLLLEAARKAVTNLRQYFEEIDISTSDDEGKAAKDLVSNLKSLSGVIAGLKDLEDAVRKERVENTSIRKQVVVNNFNR